MRLKGITEDGIRRLARIVGQQEYGYDPSSITPEGVLQQKYNNDPTAMLVGELESGGSGLNTIDAVSFALESGADFNTGEGKPLMLAVKANNIDLVSMLLQYGASASVRYDGGSVIAQAAFYSSPEIVQLLLDNGAPVTSKAIEYANQAGNTDVLNLLNSYGA